jgi:hypothetical protein
MPIMDGDYTTYKKGIRVTTRTKMGVCPRCGRKGEMPSNGACDHVTRIVMGIFREMRDRCVYDDVLYKAWWADLHAKDRLQKEAS